MKILNVFNQYLERGGEADAVDSIVQSLSKIAGVERCDFSSHDWVGPERPSKFLQGIYTLHNPRSTRQLSDYQSRFTADMWLVHNVFPVGSAAVYLEAQRLHIPIVQYLHNFRPFSVSGYFWLSHSVPSPDLSPHFWREIQHATWQDSRLKTAWLAFVLWIMRTRNYWRSVKAWIAVSEFVRNKFIEAGIAPEQIFTVRHFWNSHVTSPNSSEGNHYLFLGRLIEAKGVGTLLECWKILEKEFGLNAPKLVIAGDGPMRDRVVQACAELKRVVYVGRVGETEKRKALESAKAVIVPSLWWEPLGLVVYEAYDYSRPVLAAASGALPEIVADRQTGLIHQPGHAEELARHVIEFERDAHLRLQLGHAGRNWLLENANEETWRKKFMSVAEYALSVAT